MLILGGDRRFVQPVCKMLVDAGQRFGFVGFVAGTRERVSQDQIFFVYFCDACPCVKRLSGHVDLRDSVTCMYRAF
jgi:hypothetical protein